MSKQRLLVFLCQGEDCRKAWRRVCDGSPAKWLKRHVKEAGLPYKLRVIETSCQDRCEDAANLCAVCGRCAALATKVRSPDDADGVLATLRSCVERSEVLSEPEA